jgi:predicted transcriptional regulator
MTDNHAELLDATATVLQSYLANNNIDKADLPGVITSVYDALKKNSTGEAAEPKAMEKMPAVPVKKSVTPDFLVCLEDGKKFKSLKRHLRTAYDMTPDDYRKKWGLPSDYPMVAPSYAEKRSTLAKGMGLGKMRKA